jgi:hypothetical protein
MLVEILADGTRWLDHRRWKLPHVFTEAHLQNV